MILAGMLLGTTAGAEGKYWLFFADKGPEAEGFRLQPERMLSARALARLAQHRQVPGQRDIPVSRSYIDRLTTAGVQIHSTSRWLNAVSVSTDLDFRSLQRICPQIRDMRPVGTYVLAQVATPQVMAGDTPTTGEKEANVFDYGQAQFQNEMLGLECLHNRGITGAGVLVAVFDAGFYHVDTLAPFDSLWAGDRVVGWYDFVDDDTTVFNASSHGLGVLSTIVANSPGIMVGTAPHASVAMARTETVFKEVHQEEDNWLLAVEWADSIGADIIQSSLGYNTFDRDEGDYSYADLDGNTTIVTRAADIAASRGILVVNSAGNEGAGSWHYITAPCDADSILCVGATDMVGTKAGFSSVGPTADGRIKPDVMALGLGSTIIGMSGSPTFGTGTSYAAPQMAGFAACLMQAHPERTNMEVIQAIMQSGDRHLKPDTAFGHGTPDACRADSILSVMDSLALSMEMFRDWETYFKIYPNPVEDFIVVDQLSPDFHVQSIEILAQDGGVVHRESVEAGTALRKHEIVLKDMAAGMYVLKLVLEDGKTISHKFIRQ